MLNGLSIESLAQLENIYAGICAIAKKTNDKQYTAPEMRRMADCIGSVKQSEIPSWTEGDIITGGDLCRSATMLRYAADVVERCEKEIDATSCKGCQMSLDGRQCSGHRACGLHDFHNRFIAILHGSAEKGESK